MSDSEISKPFYKNPYVIAFVAGIITITAIRPFTRHIPDPPPIIGAGIPAFSAVSPNGNAFDYGQLSGHVHIASLVSADGHTNSLAIIEAQRALHKSLTNNIQNAAILTLVLPGTGRLSNVDTDLKPMTHSYPWLLAYLSDAEESKEWSHFYGDMGVTSLVADAVSSKLVLIDRHGRIRGSYDIGKWGVDEAFYRTTHVLDESLNSPESHNSITKN